jgi:phytoene synthase
VIEPNFNILLQSADPDRRLSALFAPVEQRQRLFALYAFNHEISRVADAISESLIGEMKLTWWRDAISDLYADPANVRRHDVTESLACLTQVLSEAELLALIEPRFQDVSARAFADQSGVLDYVDATSGAIMRLALRLSGVELDPGWIRDAGRAWGLTGLLRAFPHRARIGRAPLGADALATAEATPAMLAQGLGESKITPALNAVRASAVEAVAAFSAHGALPAEAVPALGYTVLAKGYLQRLPQKAYSQAGAYPLVLRQVRLLRASVLGS